MRYFRSILIIGVIEILIGSVSIISNLLTLAVGTNQKTFGVLCFVMIAATCSFLIGVGILLFNKTAYRLLLWFSSFIVLSKILILLGVLELSSALQTNVSSPISSIISIAYHGYIIYYLKRRKIKKIFHIT